ncbi:MAG: DNA polymerase/3'-5' exonuclease PolX [Candidatus Firestonebacteria bacterium]
MNNAKIGEMFYKISKLLEIDGENMFRVRAYYKASEILSVYPVDLEKIYKEKGMKGLREISGVGERIALKIEEYVKTGKISQLEELERKFPEGLIDLPTHHQRVRGLPTHHQRVRGLLSVSGMGPKKVKQFFEKLKIKSMEELEQAAKEHKLCKLPGMGKKSEEKILKGIEFLKKWKGKVTLGVALPLANLIINKLKKIKEIDKIEVAGSVRRGKETIKDIDILITSNFSTKIMDRFTELNVVSEVLAKGETKSSILTKDGIQVDLRVIKPECFGAALNYFTGSKEHNIHLRELAIKKGLKVNEYGVTRENEVMARDTEEHIYKVLGLQYIPPEIREDRGEIELAAKNQIPKLVEESDIKGDLHIHTKASDGTDDLEDIILKCQKKGYKYIGITEHSQSLKVARGLDKKSLLVQIKTIRKLNEKLKDFYVLSGSEVDIKSDGSLDYNDDVLNELDFVIGSIHTNFNMKKDEMTKRVIKAIRTKKMHIFGHPSGRLLGEREGYEIDLDEIIKAAKDYGVALELNAYPKRLDLIDVYCKVAKEKNVLVCLNTDAHSKENLNWMSFGVITARRGWLEKKDVLNCKELKDLLNFLKKG